MSQLDQQVSRARQRLTGNLFLQRLSLGLLLAAGSWALAILVVRLFALGVPLEQGAWLAALLAALIGVVGTAISRPSTLHAAVVLDASAGLKERLSTALLVRRTPDAFAQAAVRDAERLAGQIHVPAHIRYRLPSLWPWSLAAALAALILLQFMPTVGLLRAASRPEAQVSRAELQAERAAINAELRDQLNKIKEIAKDNPALKDIAKDILALEIPDRPGVTQEDLRRQAVKRIADVSDRLQRQLEAVETSPLREMKRMLGGLQPEGGTNTTEKLSQALASGNFEVAGQALKDLQKELEQAAGKAGSPDAQLKLAEMQQQLARLAEQVGKLSDTVQLQKELENKAGLSEEQARKLLEELARLDPGQLEKELQKRLGDKGLSQEQVQKMLKKMQQCQEARQACRKLAQALAETAQAAQQCSNPGAASTAAAAAASALSDAASQLSDLAAAGQLADELQARLSDLEKLRDRVCQGQCRVAYPGRGDSDRVGNQGPYGLGPGARIGKENTRYKTEPTRAPTRFPDGTVIGQVLIDSPQVRSEVSREVLAAAEAEVREALDAIEREELPRQYRKVLREYFERLAGLVRERQIDRRPRAGEGN